MSETDSYVAVHWPKTGYHVGPQYRDELVGVALLEDTLRTTAADYAKRNQFDYAKRIIDTGSVIVDAALNIALNVSSDDLARRVMRLKGVASQLLDESLDRYRIPRNLWAQYSGGADRTDIPEELLTIYDTAWKDFIDQYEIQDLMLGRQSAPRAQE